MTELALRDTGRLEVAPPAPLYTQGDPTGGRLVAWAHGLEAAHRIGSALCRTAFVPKHFQGKPDDSAAAILFGDEIGLSPTQALRSIYVIGGTPSLYARAMVALVQSKGHEVWTETDTPAKVIVCGQRRGSNRVERSEWTTERARKAGYTTNAKYTSDPQAMLYARAASDVCRKVAADALAGLAYTVEEMELEEASPATVTLQRDDAPPRTARRAPAPAPVASEPPLDPAPTPDAPVVDLITGPQLKKLHAALGDIGIKDRDAAHAWMTEQTGREITSAKDLTKDEASRLIDGLANAPVVEDPPFDDAAWQAGAQ